LTKRSPTGGVVPAGGVPPERISIRKVLEEYEGGAEGVPGEKRVCFEVNTLKRYQKKQEGKKKNCGKLQAVNV